MLEHERSRLFAMAPGTGFVQPRHCQATRVFHDVLTVWVVALHAVHPVLNDRMMMRQIKLGVRFEMALKAGRGIFAGIDDEFASAARRDVSAPRPVA